MTSLYLIDMTINGNATNQSITSMPEAVDFRRDMAAIVSPVRKVRYLQYKLCTKGIVY